MDERDELLTRNDLLVNYAVKIADLKARVSTQDDGLRHGEMVCAEQVQEIADLKAEVATLRDALETKGLVLDEFRSGHSKLEAQNAALLEALDKIAHYMPESWNKSHCNPHDWMCALAHGALKQGRGME